MNTSRATLQVCRATVFARWLQRALLALVLSVTLIPSAVLTQSTPPAKRIALIIGNDAYKGTGAARDPDWPRLQNAGNDARAIGERLRQMGFTQVQVLQDLTRRKVFTALQSFSEQVATADQAVFYYAGHGVQLRDRNYLIPVDAALSMREADLRSDAVPLDEVMESVSRGQGQKLVILDACRTLPQGFRGATESGFANPEARGKLPPQTLVVFASQAGEVASDGLGRSNGLFALGLLKGLNMPEPTLFNVIAHAEEEVLRLSDQRQRPVMYGSPLAQRMFRFAVGTEVPNSAPPPRLPAPVVAQASVPVVQTDAAADQAFWSSIQGRSEPQWFLEYQVRFPQGQYRRQAQERGGIAYRTASGCHVREPVLVSEGVEVDWSGQCLNGLAEGRGKKTYSRSGAVSLVWDAQFRRGVPFGTWTGEHQNTGANDRKLTTLSFNDIGQVQRRQSFEMRSGAKYSGDTDATEVSQVGRPHGVGVMDYADGGQYDGEWVQEKRHGRGTLRYPRSPNVVGPVLYEGEFKDNVPSGRGRMVHSNGGVYEGEWLNGQRHGRGRINYADGGAYDGQWAMDRRSGFGTLSYPPSNDPGGRLRFVGQFEAEQINGQGTLTFRNNGKYEGNFINGEADGLIRVTRPDGVVFTTTFNRGVAVDRSMF